MDKDRVLAVLKQGMSTELWGRRFYEEAAERTEAENGKMIFASLVDEENKHLDILRGQYVAVGGDKGFVSTEEAIALASSVKTSDIFPEPQATDQLISAGATDEQALQLAMEFEQRGYNYYQQQAKQADLAEAKKMWEWLAKAENWHYTFLQETLDYLANNGAWYFDDQEKPIFEG